MSVPLLAACEGGALGGESGQDDARTDLPGRSALLAPMSGRSPQLGQIMEKAASLGGNVLGNTGEMSLFDTGDTPEAAAAAATAAVTAGARILVGPLYGDQAAAVGRAVGSRVPVITLSNDNGVAGNGVFVIGVTPEQSARSILSFAGQRGMGSVGIVVPPGEFGQRAAAAALTTGQGLGLRMVGPVTTSDPSVAAATLREAAGGTLPAAVFLPSGGPELDALASAFSGTQLLGSSQWSTRDPTRSPALEGAWFSAPDPVAFEPFAVAYEEVYGEGAGILAGVAFDAVETARLLGRIRQQDEKGLLRENGFNGVIGPYRFLPDGTCSRGLAVVKVSSGTISLVGAASA